MTEEGIVVKRDDAERAINKISEKDRTNGLDALIQKILSDL